jgi:hypothetical protein
MTKAILAKFKVTTILVRNWREWHKKFRQNSIILGMGRLINARAQWPRILKYRPWSLGRWDCGFESRLKHGCVSSSFCVVLSGVGIGFCDEQITRPKESNQVSK